MVCPFSSFRLSQFRSGTVQVLMATKAIELGLDIPDVRATIFWQVPNTVHRLVQGFGRAGRDGMPAKAVLFHSRSDVTKEVRNAGFTESRQDVNERIAATLRREVWLVGLYAASTNECRRVLINGFFAWPGDPAPIPCRPEDERCDVCLRFPNGLPPAKSIQLITLAFVVYVRRSQALGQPMRATEVVLLFNGSNAANVQQLLNVRADAERVLSNIMLGNSGSELTQQRRRMKKEDVEQLLTRLLAGGALEEDPTGNIVPGPVAEAIFGQNWAVVPVICKESR